METINPAGTTEFSSLLSSRHISFQTLPGYLVVGTPPAEGWAIFLSLTQNNVAQVIEVLISQLIDSGAAFIMAKSSQDVVFINSGRYQNGNIGKVITVFPRSDKEALAFAKEMISAGQDKDGPAVSGAQQLKANVYVAYEVREQRETSGSRTQRKAAWPFSTIAPVPAKASAQQKFSGKYAVMETLKNDPKGEVIKAMRRRNILDFKTVVVKGGNYRMCFDSAGRDMRDRLKWQVEVTAKIEKEIRVPEVYEYFEHEGNGYIAMEYIKGEPFSVIVRAHYHQNIWLAMPLTNKLLLLEYCTEIIRMVGRLHELGFVHRDITTMNFMVEEKSICMLDLELVYSLKDNFPLPPFGIGSRGYMSPQQVAGDTPTVKEDVYALGAILQKVITGWDPYRMDTPKLRDRAENLEYFCRNVEFAKVIAKCLEKEPADRPDIAQIRDAVNAYKMRLSSAGEQHYEPGYNRIAKITKACKRVISYLAVGFQDPAGNWFSRDVTQEGLGSNEESNYVIYGGLFHGVGGIIYTLGRAKVAGFYIGDCEPAIHRSWEILLLHYFHHAAGISGDLSAGMAGLAVVLNSAAATGILPQEWNLSDFLPVCFQAVPVGYDLMRGVAGVGLSALYSLDADPEGLEYLEGIVQLILNEQQKNGSWLHPAHNEKEVPGEWPGLMVGNAGIVYFLLKYWEKTGIAAVRKAIDDALDNIVSNTMENLKDAPITLAVGISGIALSFIEAYRVTGDEQYRATATKLLLEIPEWQLFNDLTLEVGMTGIGEVYIEAYRVFGEERWLQRAGFIAETLAHAMVTTVDKKAYWLTDSAQGATADLWVGNCGILHFLLRYLRPNDFGFPGLSIS